MSELTKQALKVENNQSFPNNNAGLITPSALRTFNEDMIDSTVNQATYTTDSASFDSRIDALSGSVAVNTGSLLTTASFDNNTRNLTFTKGDSSTFAVNIPDASGSVLPPGVVSGSSQVSYPLLSNIPAGIVSGSSQLTSSFVTLDTAQSITGVKAFQGGGNRIEMFDTAKIQFGGFSTTRIGSTGGKQLVIEATSTDGANGITIVSGVSGSTSGGANTLTLQALGNQSGSEILLTSQKTRIIGDTTITGSLTHSLAQGSVLVGDVGGVTQATPTSSLSVASSVNSTYAQNTITTGKNLHNTTIAKGTPLFFTGSGTSGNLVGVFPADAGNPDRMPAGGIAGESIAVGDEGIVLLDGYIGGVDTSLFAPGDEVFVAVGGGYTNQAPTGSALIQHLGNVEKSAVNGSGVIQMMGEVRGLPNIQQGYAWVGDVNSVPQAIPTSSFGGGGTGNGFPFSGSAVITGSLSVSETVKSQVYMNPQTLDGFTIPTNNNAMLVGPVAVSGSIVVEGNSNLIVLSQITSSGATPLPSGLLSSSVTDFDTYSASVDSRLNNISIDTSSLATTGSNVFRGNQTITGSLFISSSDAIEIIAPNYPGAPAPGGVSITGSLGIQGNFAVVGGNFVVGQINTQKIVGENGGVLDIVSNVKIFNDGNINNARTLGVSGSVFVSQSISIGEAVRIAPSDPLPSGTTGSLAVSGSSLYFYNGAWTLVV